MGSSLTSISPLPEADHRSSEILLRMPQLKLDQMCYVKLVTTLWSQNRIKNELCRSLNNGFDPSDMTKPYDDIKPWIRVRSIIESDLNSLSIPQSVYFRLLALAEHAGSSLVGWIMELNDILNWPLDHNLAEYLHCVVWTQYGTVCGTATAQSMLTEDELPIDYKFIIACNYCPEEAYEIGSKILFDDFLLKNQIEFDRQPLVHYQVAAITNNDADFIKRLESYNRRRNRNHNLIKYLYEISCSTFYKHIYNFSHGIIYRLSTFTEFLWNDLSIDDKIHYIDLYMGDLRCIELTLRLICSLDLPDQQKVFDNDFTRYDILRSLMLHCLWKDQFFSVFNLFSNEINAVEFVSLCGIATEQAKCSKCSYWQRYYYQMYIDLWRNMPERVERGIYGSPELIAKSLRMMSWDEDIETVHKIISKIDPGLKKDVIMSYSARSTCLAFIKDKRWQFYDLFTESLLPEKLDRFEYQKYLIRHYGLSLATYFFRHRGYVHEREFFEWFFHLGDDEFFFSYFQDVENWILITIYFQIVQPDKLKLYNFKRFLLTTDIIRFCEDVVSTCGWEAEKDFLEYYFENEYKISPNCAKKITDYFLISVQKHSFRLTDDPFERFLRLTPALYDNFAEEDQLALLKYIMFNLFLPKFRLRKADRTLNKYFRGDAERIAGFKKTLMFDTSFDWYKYVRSLLKQDRRCNTHSIRKLVNWFFPNKDDVEKFKNSLSQSFIWSRLLDEGEFKLADDFIKFCLNSCPEKIAEFKNNAVVESIGRSILDKYSLNENKLRLILKWFNPNITTLSVLESTYQTGHVHGLLIQMRKRPNIF